MASLKIILTFSVILIFNSIAVGKVLKTASSLVTGERFLIELEERLHMRP